MHSDRCNPLGFKRPESLFQTGRTVSLERFLDRPTEPQRSLVVVNRTAVEPIQRMLENLFADQNVHVDEQANEEYDDDTVLLVEDGEVIATSPLQALEESILIVNSDLFKTSAQNFETIEVPAVLDGLTDHLFTLRGYPDSNKEKLLLIVVSRQIEQLAYTHGEGTLRTSFQRLSRLEDERGTRDVYNTLADSDVDVHIYGRPDWVPSPNFEVTMHGGYKDDFRRSWFVLYNPPPGKRDAYDSAVLVAVEQEPRQWDGFWTYRRDVVADVAEYIRHNL